MLRDSRGDIPQGICGVLRGCVSRSPIARIATRSRSGFGQADRLIVRWRDHRLLRSWLPWHWLAGSHRDAYVAVEIENALKREGCPVCLLARNADIDWMDSFLYEGYQVKELLHRIVLGPGFCSVHGRRLLQHSLAASTAASVHAFLTGRILALLDEGTRTGRAWRLQGLPSGRRCEICDHDREVEDRTAFFLARMLRGGKLIGYGAPGIVCPWHLNALVTHLPDQQIEGLLQLHLDLHSRTTERLNAIAPAVQAATAPTAALDLVDDLAARILSCFSRDRRYTDLLPARCDDTNVDPVRRMRRRLADRRECPVCAEVGAAWREWIAWLDTAARNGQVVEDLLPTCRRHVQEVLSHGGPALRLHAIRRAIAESTSRLIFALKAIHPERPISRGIRQALAYRIQIEDGPRQARRTLDRPLHCPLCSRTGQAGESAIDLIAALLAERAGRAAFEHGYGLCVRHAVQAMTRQPSTAAAVAAVTRARLLVLLWELEEQDRKRAWHTRPEAHGTESSAWQRAIVRFSGTAREDGP